MFFHEKSYDIDELMRHNMHIHTTGFSYDDFGVSFVLCSS